MDWYYAEGENRKGPVGDEELLQLARTGAIDPHTRVWNAGMKEWQAFHTTGLMAPSASVPTGVTSTTCAECGKGFPEGDLIPLSGAFYCESCKGNAVQRLREGVPMHTRDEEMRKKYLSHEATLKSVGVLYLLGGVVMMLMGGFKVLSAMFEEGVQAIIPAVVLLALGLGQWCVGSGLRGFRMWTRLPVGILSGIGLLAFPIGTVINGYVLYLLFSQKGATVFSQEYQGVMERTPQIQYKTPTILLVGLVLVIILGFVAAWMTLAR